MSSLNKLLYHLKHFLGLTSLMFSITLLIYTLFYKSFGENFIAISGVFEALGLAIIFSAVLLGLSYLSHCLSILATKAFIFIQYLTLLIVLVAWAIYFEWGEWHDPIYVLIFVGVFTVTYFIVYFFLNLKMKKEEVLLNKHLKKYQDNLD